MIIIIYKSIQDARVMDGQRRTHGVDKFFSVQRHLVVLLAWFVIGSLSVNELPAPSPPEQQPPVSGSISTPPTTVATVTTITATTTPSTTSSTTTTTTTTMITTTTSTTTTTSSTTTSTTTSSTTTTTTTNITVTTSAIITTTDPTAMASTMVYATAEGGSYRETRFNLRTYSKPSPNLLTSTSAQSDIACASKCLATEGCDSIKFTSGECVITHSMGSGPPPDACNDRDSSASMQALEQLIIW